MNKTTKRKKVNRSTDYLQLSPFSDFIDFDRQNALIHFPSKDQWRERLCYAMREYPNRDDALTVMGFSRYIKIHHDTILDWVSKYDDVREAYKYMKMAIADNRQVGTMTKKLNGEYAYRDMFTLMPGWKDVDRYHADLKKDTEQKETIINVHLTKPEVTPKKEGNHDTLEQHVQEDTGRGDGETGNQSP
jgi:hypothetical protein